jgi:glucose-6-phosphate isomerase
MKQIAFSCDHAAIPSEIITELHTRLEPEIGRLQAAWGAGYDTEYASLSLPSDSELLQQVAAIAHEKKSLNPRILIVIGIGGSNLGAMAIQKALGTNDLVVYFADTVDPTYTGAIYRHAERVLKEGQEILITVISKSGTTTETIANAQLFTALLQQYKKEFTRNIVVISDEGSALSEVAKKHQLSYFSVPQKVGGRYSVFSAVGLFPLYMMGIDIDALCDGAESVKASCTDTDLHANLAALSAATLYYLYQKGMNIHDTFAFSHSLLGIGEWYRQLMAESIGKADTKDGKRVHVGITPTVSIGSVDLHSMAQLYLGGPNNRVTTFLTIADQPDMPVPDGTLFDSLVPMIQGKSFTTIMRAILHGTQKAYEHAGRPFMTIELPEISAYYCGQLLQFKMVEIMYLGFLFDINPFNQPQVELYKKETRKMLSHE